MGKSGTGPRGMQCFALTQRIFYLSLMFGVCLAPIVRADFTVRSEFLSQAVYGETKYTLSGQMVTYVSPVGIRAEVTYDKKFYYLPDKYVAVLRFDKKQAWLAKPNNGKLHWIDYKKLKKSLRKYNRAITAHLAFFSGENVADTLDPADQKDFQYWWNWGEQPGQVMLGDSCSSSWRSFSCRYGKERQDSMSLRWTAQWSNTSPLLDTLEAYLSFLEDSIFESSCLNCQYAGLRDTSVLPLWFGIPGNLTSLLIADSLNNPCLNYSSVVRRDRYQLEYTDKKSKIHLQEMRSEEITTIRLQSYDFDSLPESLFKQPKDLIRGPATDDDVRFLISMLMP